MVCDVFMSKLEKNTSVLNDIHDNIGLKRFHIMVYDDDILKWGSVREASTPKKAVFNEMSKYDSNYDYDVDEWNIEVFEANDVEGLYKGYGDITEYATSEYLLKTKIPVYKTSIIKHKGGNLQFVNEDFCPADDFI